MTFKPFPTWPRNPLTRLHLDRSPTIDFPETRAYGPRDKG